MSNEEDRRGDILSRLRAASERGPGQGLRRAARLVRSGVGLARNAMQGGGEDSTLDARTLVKMEALVRSLGELKGLPMKFGQILSYLDLDMPEELRRMIGTLQTQSAATPNEQVREIVLEDLGPRGETLWAGLEPAPISIASIGQVYRGRLPTGLEVAVKVRHPTIEEAIRSDFEFAGMGTAFANVLMPGMGATAKDFVAELRARLLEECDYALEAQRQRTFARLFADHPTILVPEVHDEWCGARVLTSSWEPGEAFEDFVATASQVRRDAAGAALFEFYIGTLYRHGLFHADPHPGNYSFRADGRVVVFDYGCVRIFPPDVGAAFGRLADAVRIDERAAIEAALRELGAEPSSNDDAYDHLRKLLRSFFGPMLVDGPHPVDAHIVVEMRQVAKDKLAIARMRLPGSLVLLFRIRFGLFAVLARLGAVADWAGIERGFRDSGSGSGSA